MTQEQKGKVWATLLTNESYLPGITVFQESLRRNQSRYPLVALVTGTLSTHALSVLEDHGILTKKIDLLLPPDSNRSHLDEHDSRFADTWTKLRVFEMVEYERVVLVDSDMLVMRNMDELMEMDLEEGGGSNPTTLIAAVHACTCNPRQLSHYPANWIPENCAHTRSSSTQALSRQDFDRPTHHLLNGGLVVLTPSVADFELIQTILYTDPAVKDFKFPDQDLLAYAFRGRFEPLPYVYNALKTLRACHDQLWDDEDVKNVHYIIDKPWKQRVASWQDDIEPNAVTHSWWWDAFDRLSDKYSGTPSWHYVTNHVNQISLVSQKPPTTDLKQLKDVPRAGGAEAINVRGVDVGEEAVANV